MHNNKLVVAIIGVGLIGGSMGMALKYELGDAVEIRGCALTKKELNLAKKLGAIDKGFLDPCEAVQGAFLVYIATPVLQIIPTIKKIMPHLLDYAIITDAGSTKSSMAEEIFEILKARDDLSYVPGHPMTGREHSGVEAAQADLFYNKAYVLVKDSRIDPDALQSVKDVIRFIGGLVFEISLSQHDRCASLISHIPHITASALVNLLELNPKDKAQATKLAGGGFKDTTRIASSNAIMWRDICLANKEEILKHLAQLRGILEEMEQAIDREDGEAIENFFTKAKNCRDKLIKNTNKKYELI